MFIKVRVPASLELDSESGEFELNFADFFTIAIPGDTAEEARDHASELIVFVSKYIRACIEGAAEVIVSEDNNGGYLVLEVPDDSEFDEPTNGEIYN